MKLALFKVVPKFFPPSTAGSSEVWNQSLEFDDNSRVHIIAPSGKGKTSLIHFIYLLRKDYEGKIMLGNHPAGEIDPEQTAAVRSEKMSIVFQDLRLFEEQTLYQNIFIKRTLNPYGSDKIREMAGRLGIGTRLHAPAANCSYGEKQRAAIIRALQQPFEWLLLDEPFSHLDSANRQAALQLIEEEAGQRNASILLVDLEKRDYFKADKILYL